ncbi:MAG: hypothetical protein NMK33_00650 [Candidatus Cardinium sp.]|uniref:hypothetical protein n=1 Tax=Cardinium endosymbiont of Dermatophagoides farinae TaxID=2597823 RepID=UPI001642C78E|nr:hypothetical protein [Cardinium endosymbiont of Dermatophagoides farinae]UWW97062.1 MAG: hypothetical protein NMK33_00650 [Candidatus Cardinium sp.]
MYRNDRPSTKPIYDQQFLGETQSSTAEYLGVFEERRPQNCHLAIGFEEGLMT